MTKKKATHGKSSGEAEKPPQASKIDPTPVIGPVQPSQNITKASKPEPISTTKGDKEKKETPSKAVPAVTKDGAKIEEAMDRARENGISVPDPAKKPDDWQIHKERGNACYKLGKWAAAVDEYRTAIELCPTQAVLYANKAMALLKLDRFEDVVVECTTAIGLDSKFLKAYFRRAQALLKLNRNEEARADLNQVLLIEPKNAEAKRELGILNNMHLHKGFHPSIDCLSSAISVVFDEDRGRKLIAAERIPAGALVLNEPAMSWWINDTSATQLCQGCTGVLPEEPLFCDECKNTAVRFCSEMCREYANVKFHKYECGRPDAITENDSQKMAILSQRLLCSQPNKPDLKEHCADREFGTEEGDEYGSNLRSVLSLGDKPGVTDVTDYDQAVEQSTVLHDTFLKECQFKGDVNAVDKMTSLMHRIIPKIHLNHASLCSPSEDCPDERAIHAFFASYALTNHSCLPNLFRQNTGLRLQLRTTRPIQAGEELTTTYGPEFSQQTKLERQAILQHHYGFTCDCAACTLPVMLQRERDLHSYHCRHCKKRAYVNSTTHKIICGSCMKSQSYTPERVNGLPDMIMQYDKSTKETAQKLMASIGCNEDQMNTIACLHSLKTAHACMNYAVYIMGDISEGVDVAQHMVHMAAGLYGDQGAHFTIEYIAATLRVLLVNFQDKYGQLVAELIRKLIKLFVQYFGVENGRKEFVTQLLDVHWYDKYYIEFLPIPDLPPSLTTDV